MSDRKFILNPAVREQVPLFVGLVGPSGVGKTYSALRLATGMKQVHGGPIVLIDTENRRGLHYATDFDFLHMPFGAPFGSLDYLAAITEAAKHNPSAIIIDSMSHEHEGPGGLLDAHEKALDAMVGAGAEQWKRDAAGFAAWAKPKANRRALLQGLTRLNANVIACFRAQEKVKPIKNEKGKNVPTNIGWGAITDQTFVYEMALCALMLPGARGVPTWTPEMEAERAFVKRPGQFHDLFRDGAQLDEIAGRALAEWAKGGEPRGVTDSFDADALTAEGDEAARLGMSFLVAFWKRLTPQQQARLAKIKDETWKPMAETADASLNDEKE
jgi:hypothetical protein